jgi:flagellar hook protein FlgE
MINALSSILKMIGVEAGNLAGANVNGYKKKAGSIGTNGDGAISIGNDFYSRTDYSQGQTINSSSKTDMAIQGEGFFVLFDETSSASFDPGVKLSQLNQDQRFDSPITSGSFSVNGFNVNVDAANDSFNDVLNRIGTATAGQVTAVYDAKQNAVVLTNNSGVPGNTITFGVGATSNFLDQAKLTNSVTQSGPSNKNFLVSSDPVGRPGTFRQLYYTRQGSFNFDDDGFLVNGKGLFVASIDPKTGNLTKTDKKTFDGRGTNSDEVHFTANGILFNDTEGVKQGKQLALASFPYKNGLIGAPQGGEIFIGSASAGTPIFAPPGSSGMGTLADQSLEGSNSSTAESLTNLGILQKFFPATVSALKVSFSVQDDLNNNIK